jgi:hypothetical protein
MKKTYVVEICHDETEDAKKRAENDQVLPERIRQVVVHGIDIFGKAVHDASQRSRVKKGHRCSKDLPHGVVGHSPAGCRADGGGDERKREQEEALNYA